MIVFQWKRRGKGFEVSSKGKPPHGDKRFSAFSAILPEGVSIERIYQCRVKGHDPVGLDWRKGKGKPPVLPMSKKTLFEKYLALWETWARANPELIKELREKAIEHNDTLTDMFATTFVNQANALSCILNKIERGEFELEPTEENHNDN